MNLRSRFELKSLLDLCAEKLINNPQYLDKHILPAELSEDIDQKIKDPDFRIKYIPSRSFNLWACINWPEKVSPSQYFNAVETIRKYNRHLWNEFFPSADCLLVDLIRKNILQTNEAGNKPILRAIMILVYLIEEKEYFKNLNPSLLHSLKIRTMDLIKILEKEKQIKYQRYSKSIQKLYNQIWSEK